MDTTKGLAWMEKMATRYEEAALRLRAAIETVARVEATEPAAAPKPRARKTPATRQYAMAVDGVGITEAIRMVLSPSTEAMRTGDILRAINDRGIALSTTSEKPRNVIAARLAAMASAGEVRGDGKSGWRMVGSVAPLAAEPTVER